MQEVVNESIGIDLKGRIQSLKVSERNMLLPLFEAIVNSIHAIEDAIISDGRIDIYIKRAASLPFNETEFGLPPIDSFEIVDNGIGFNEANYSSFRRAHSTYKADRGGKGIGRFVWLKAFDEVRIESTYFEDGIYYKRSFRFNVKNSIDRPVANSLEGDFENQTKVQLRGYKEPYKSKCPKKIETIANRIIEHCLVYFLRNDCPNLILHDGATQINLNDRFTLLSEGNIFTELFKLEDYQFKINLLKWYEHDELTHHKLSFCAHNREVEDVNLNKVFKDLHGKINDEKTGKDFLIVGYLESEYFDEFVNDERTQIEFVKEGVFDFELLSIEKIFAALEPVIKNHFEDVIESYKSKKLLKLNRFISEKAPQYKILEKHDGVLENIVVTEHMTEQEIDLKLYKAYQEIDFDSRRDVTNILKITNNIDEDPDILREKYLKVLQGLTELNTSKLAQYVVHRRYIIELFENSLSINPNGKYELEKTVHDIVFPTKKDSTDIDYNDQNLWLIDERLSFHTFLTSDKPLNSIEGLETTSTERPDLLVFNNPMSFVEGEDRAFNSIILVEFKRPMREHYDPEKDNPIEQVYDYVNKIRKGRQLTKDGRRFTINDNTWFYTYIIVDINDKIDRWASYAQLSKSYDGLGYYGYNKDLKCMVEILTFDQVLINAKQRNKVLFHKLGI